MRITKLSAVVTLGGAAVLAAAGGIAVAADDQAGSDDLTRPGTVTVDESSLPEDDVAEREALARLATVDEDAATSAAIDSIGSGEVLAAELEDEHGFVVWEVHVRSADGTVEEVIVDAGNASVLGAEREDDDTDD
jgi:uncharacterized membrane protein YkoI